MPRSAHKHVARARWFAVLSILPVLLLAGGCRSPYRSDQGALLGGLGGAGLGAIVGKQLGNTAGGAAVGAVAGLVTGSVIGNELDEIEAKNRAQIEATLGRQVAAGAVTTSEVVAMTEAGVATELIVSHVRSHGVAAPLTTEDVITLSKQGVDTQVIKAMQSPPAPRQVVQPAPQPVVVHEYHDYGYPHHYRRHHYHHNYHRRRHHRSHSDVHWGVSFGH